jgi:hypothetical protein
MKKLIRFSLISLLAVILALGPFQITTAMAASMPPAGCHHAVMVQGGWACTDVGWNS